MQFHTLTRLALMSATALAGFSAVPAQAQEADAANAESGDVIVVTATRRAVSLQDVPINIAAMSSEQIQEQGVQNVRDLAAFTPGVTIRDTGPGNTGTIVMRGLSANDASSTGSNNSTMLTTYMGEVPLYLDVKFLDIERVETLLGPQGTLYGSATMAGAMRYIPARPDPDKWSGKFHGRLYDVAHASDPGFSVDGTINIPIIPGKVALRSTAGYYNDPGFIDYNYLVQTPGVSLPQPGSPTTWDGSIGTPDQIAQNLWSYKDANSELTYSTRNQLGLFPFDGLNVYLTYLYQQTSTNGRQSNGGGVLGTGKYEAPWRYLEPVKRKSQMLSAEIELDLAGIAQLVSSTAWSERKIRSKSDVTDLLLDLDYGYEMFPAFAGYATGDTSYRQFTQEVRFVSTHGGPLSWVLGGFYNKLKYRSDRREILPGYPEWAGIYRPDAVEYASYVKSKDTEKAVFGEATLEPVEGLTLTAGARYFKYDSYIIGGTALPLFQTYPQINFRSREGTTADDGMVWKFNASYKLSPEWMVYGTYSKGYRIGGVNRVAPCVLPLPAGQNLCALPDELFFAPDTVKNAELGVRATLFDRRLSASLSVYHIDWAGIQLAGQTINGAIGITTNGGAAVSKGVEFNFSARPIDALRIMGTYSYNDAHLTEDVPLLMDVNGGPKVSALSGDRLPGSTKNSGSLGVTYTVPAGDGDIDLNWTATYTGNVLTRVGGRAGGEKLPAYTLHRASVAYKLDGMEIRLYADNIFDKFAVASVGNDLTRRILNDGVVSRYYANTIISPRKVGIEFTKSF
ncbi:TonB-dependent receptor [Sphingobium jiangsuense]|uniref:Outer membrane receptor protein involved in Fe transport n=1 Tax=Sphingobium jiangsuense TaxID=870476 RepID=A0A7W6BQI0_9SPHN|nr:TonB-dependent receptor [Sphingobium jiangsuense]MBB3926019.1 outer membrane receptor protein involved in Fe transport [Sphingobium jiangsuense]GLS98951.1 TonB-dependent receptor [Sphingobium jiangsuense]